MMNRTDRPGAKTRRRVSMDEIRAISTTIGWKLTRDLEYLEDLIQEGMIAATNYQRRDPEAPTALLGKIIFREQLRRMSKDRLDNRSKTWRGGPPASYEQLAAKGHDLGASDGGIQEVLDRMEREARIDAIWATLDDKRAEVLDAMLAADLSFTVAAKSLGMTRQNVHHHWDKVIAQARAGLVAA